MIRRQQALEVDCLSEFDPPLDIYAPEDLSSPVIFCSPHSGRHYPESFTCRTPHGLLTLRQNEDAFMDTLFAAAPLNGAPLLAARFPRCLVDVGRAPDELPESWLAPGQSTTARANAGLGVVPISLGDDLDIYRWPLKPSAVSKRLEALYYPYHSALHGLIANAKTKFGHAVIIDCHSMPGFSISGARRSDIILGDRFGTSCTPGTMSLIDNLFSECGYAVTRNYPYAGSFVTSHYGQPHDRVEAIQIEINRDLYLNPVTMGLKKNYHNLARDLSHIIHRLTEAFRQDLKDAAE